MKKATKSVAGKGMSGKALGIFFDCWGRDYGRVSVRIKRPWNLYWKAVWLKANPRSEEYMRMLFFAHCPEGDFVNVTQDSEWRERVRSAEEIILLYPDAIGLGFGGLELQLFQRIRSGTEVHVMNGRRREFALIPSRLFGLYLRRYIERWMLAEILAIFVFLIATPPLLVVDWVRGRR